jgi:hypothetical protein
VASPEEVEAVLSDLSQRLERVDPDLRRTVLPPRRSLEATFPDLGVAYHAFLEDGQLGPLRKGTVDGPADIRLVTTSDDLVALAAGRLNVLEAYTDGRLKLNAPMGDILRLKGMW